MNKNRITILLGASLITVFAFVLMLQSSPRANAVPVSVFIEASEDDLIPVADEDTIDSEAQSFVADPIPTVNNSIENSIILPDYANFLVMILIDLIL
jgi:hypothetical protein